MVNHKVRHLQQRLVTTNLFYFEVTIRVHLHEHIKGSPLEQTFPIKSKRPQTA